MCVLMLIMHAQYLKNLESKVLVNVRNARQVPLLTYDGEQLCQSIAIARFLANEYGLAGQSNLQKAQVPL
jgi:glutathione S-transferase